MIVEMAAAALQGLLVCETSPYLAAGDGAAWSEWIAPLLTSAISAAPLDLIDDWSTALRLGLNGLALTPTGLQQLLDLVAGMVAPGVLHPHQRAMASRLCSFINPWVASHCLSGTCSCSSAGTEHRKHFCTRSYSQWQQGHQILLPGCKLQRQPALVART